jgi:hypothetical protein
LVDVFDEVESELRSERYTQLFRRLIPWIVAGAIAGVLVVAGVFGWQTYRESVANKASDAYASGLKSLQMGDSEGAFRQFGQVPATAKGYRSLALMQQGGIRLAAGDSKQAVALFDQAADVAPGGEVGLFLADAARLKSAFALMDQGSYPEIEKRLKPLTEEKRPYRSEAREALALAKLQAGKTKEARQDLIVLSLANDAPDSLKGRARTTAQMIDAGLLNNVGEIVKAASAVPAQPAPQLGIPGLEGLLGAQGGQPGPEGVQVAPQGAPQ